MSELKTKDLIKAQKKASKESISITKALGQPYITVKNGILYRIEPDGKQIKLRKATFGTKKINKKIIKINNGNETS